MLRPHIFPAFARLLLSFLFVPGALLAQDLPKLSSPDQDQSQPSEDQPISSVKVNVNVVQLFFNVKDKKGGLIPNLTKNDFQVSEDGKPQTIKYFAAESNLPLTLGILIDASGSQQRVLDMEKEVDLLQDFTSSVHSLKTALNTAKINTGGGAGTIPGLGGGPVPSSTIPRGTLLYDAIYLAAHDELAQQVGRKAMIILTDGEDQGSQLKIQDAVEAAQKSDSIVYVLLCADRGFYGFGGYSGEGQMKKLTQETGGRVIEVGNKMDKLKQAFDQVAQELRSQYNVGYTPTNAALDGTFRKVEIHANSKDYKIQARTGYYATPRKD